MSHTYTALDFNARPTPRRFDGSKNRATGSPPHAQPAWTGNDMSASTATLTLMLLATVAAVHSDHPTFWLSIGPAPLAAGLAALTFFRRKYGRHRRVPPDRIGDIQLDLAKQ